MPYLPALDGLRALAIGAVLVYHLRASWLPGGFLGVDVFFALSGYLITSGLLAEWDSGRRIDLVGFYRRRARRLLPAAIVLLLAVLALAELFAPTEVRALRSVSLAAAAYSTNWFFIVRNQPYFETIAHPPVLQHLWSLAVEEQFYLVWPLVLFGALRVLPRRVVLLCTLALAGASTLLMAWLYADGVEATRLYYGTDTHASGLLCGAALAFVWRPWAMPALTRRASLALQGAAMASLVALGWLVVWLADWRPLLWRGGFLLVALLSVVAIAAAARSEGRFVRALGCIPLRWVGLRSYGLYLWHPPAFVAMVHTGLPVPEPVLLALQAAAALVLAELSYRVVELPVRNGALGRLWREARAAREGRRPRRVAALGAASLAALLAVVGIVGVAVSASAPRTPEYLALTAINGLVLPEVATVGARPDGSPPAVAEARSPALTGTTPAAVKTAAHLGASTPAATATELVGPLAPEPVGPPLPTATASGTAIPRGAADAVGASRALTSTAGARIFAIGDSVMLGAAPALAAAFGPVEMDAAVGRDVASTVRILRERRDGQRLGDVVIVHVGNNGPFTRPQFDDMMEVLAGVPLVLVVNLHVPQPWETSNNALFAGAIVRYPNARLVDWYRASDERAEEIFYDDDMHLKPEGATTYARLLSTQAAVMLRAVRPGAGGG